jgi:murein DD-endopeptidase MepM/ murein hydrolase activator NlpD
MALRARQRPPDEYAITISGGADSRLVQFQLSKRLAHAIVAAALILLLVILSGIVALGGIIKRLHEMDDVRAENLLLRRQITRMGELEARVGQMDQTRRDLLRLLGVDEELEDPAASQAPPVNQAHATSIYQPMEPGGDLLEEDLAVLSRFIHVLPLEGPVTRTYGPLPGQGVFHAGIDVAGDSGSEIRAAGDGIVAQIADDDVFGQVLVIAHEPGIATMYGHNSRILCALGDYVTAGKTVAEVGNTGQSSAPHLHFEVHWKQRAIDPALLFSAWHQPEQTAPSVPDSR